MKHKFLLSRNRKRIIILVLIIVGIITIFSLQRLINTLQTTYRVSPEVTSYGTVYNTSKTIPPEIKIIPAKKEILDHEVVSTNNCSRPEGLVTYSEKIQEGHEGEEAHMAVNSTKLNGTLESQKGLRQLDDLLSSPVKENQDLFSIENSFNAYCDSGAVNAIKELNGIYYSGMQKSKVIMAFFAQSMFPDVFIYIYGKRGDNYVRLVKRISSFDRDRFMKDCQSQSNNLDLQTTCYDKEVFMDKELEQASIKEAKNIISTFAIE